MITKECFKCKKALPLTDFYKHKEMADGHLNKCKVCNRKDTIEHKALRSQDPEWLEKEKARWRRKSEKRRNDPLNNYKNKAHALVKKAITAGVLIPQPCAKCGDPRVHGHHEDYTKPLEVVWLCYRHHYDRHIEINQELLERSMPQQTTFKAKNKYNPR